MKKTREQIQVTDEHNKILSLDCKKHQKAYLLSQTGLKNGDIALLLFTNQGAIGNALRDYAVDPSRCDKAKALIA